MPYVSRKPTPTDIEWIINLFQQLHPHGVHMGCSRKDLASSISLFAITDLGRTVGYIRQVHKPNRQAVELSLLLVEPEYQHFYLGRQLVHHATHGHPEGTFVVSDSVTYLPYSQQIFYRERFSPTYITLADEPDIGAGQRETTIHIAKLISSRIETVSLYLPQEYRNLAQRVLSPFCRLNFQEHSPYSEHQFSHARITDSERRIIPLNYDSAPAEISWTRSCGYYLAGFTIYRRDKKIFVGAVMNPLPKERLQREQIQVLPFAQELFDFVWQQYETVRK
jgi:hypothetical protein